MPLFHFTLESDRGISDLGSLDLPHVRGVVPVGLQLVMRLLEGVARLHSQEGGWVVNVEDDAGTALFKFKVRDPGEPSASPAYERLH